MASSTEVRRGETAQFTVTVANTGPQTHEHTQVGLLALRPGGERSVPNTYLSVTASQGSCTIDPVVPPHNYTGADCLLGDLPAGGSAQIVATVEITESMDQRGTILRNGPIAADTATVRAIYPPRIEGSPAIKLTGLPDGCVDRDLKLTAAAKGATAMSARLLGPYDEWGGRVSGTARGSKFGIEEKRARLKLELPLERERAGFYHLKIKAKFENRPKQKAEVSLQRCDIPDDRVEEGP